MTGRQLPEPGEVFLDHVAHFVPEMAAAAAAMARTGFRLTPFAVQANAPPEGGPPIPSGTANRCAMLRNGYLEVLTATSDTPLSQQLRRQTERYVGLHLLAFASGDAAAERERLAAEGFRPLPAVHLRRPSAGGGEARFTVVRVPPEAMPEGRIQFLTHHTEAEVWREEDMAHPNGAISLEEGVLVVDEPEGVATRYARFLGRPADTGAGGWRIALERGRLRFLDRAAFAAEMPFAAVPSLPFIAAIRIGVADLAATRAFLAGAGLAMHETKDGGIAVTLPASLGGTVVFAPAL